MRLKRWEMVAQWPNGAIGPRELGTLHWTRWGAERSREANEFFRILLDGRWRWIVRRRQV